MEACDLKQRLSTRDASMFVRASLSYVIDKIGGDPCHLLACFMLSVLRHRFELSSEAVYFLRIRGVR